MKNIALEEEAIQTVRPTSRCRMIAVGGTFPTPCILDNRLAVIIILPGRPQRCMIPDRGGRAPHITAIIRMLHPPRPPAVAIGPIEISGLIISPGFYKIFSSSVPIAGTRTKENLFGRCICRIETRLPDPRPNVRITSAISIILPAGWEITIIIAGIHRYRQINLF